MMSTSDDKPCTPVRIDAYSMTQPPIPPQPVPFVSASGATITPLPASSSTPAPPPQWLLSALHNLRQAYPQDSFEPSMRWNNAVQEWQPKIKCNDCPGQVYKTNAPPSDPTENFRVHLDNRRHRGNVEARTGGI
jgi:SWI/SNF-related matrix-associated actin-dependent regulator of chromatin subfamily B protein 1